MSFFLEWMDGFTGSIIVFGEHSKILKALESMQDKQISISSPLFNLIISFSRFGDAKILINNQKKFIGYE